jgi:hypothetical protein
MAKILIFTPQHELDAQRNLNDFIAFARNDLTAFGEDLQFDDYVWDITEFLPVKGMGSKRHRIFFTKQTAATKNKDKQPFPVFFQPFAKAYLRYIFTRRPVQNLARQLEALRMLEIALTENDIEIPIIQIDAGILNRAAQLTKQHYSKSVAYKTGGQLQKIADFLDEKWLVMVSLNWKNPINRQKDPMGRCGAEAEKRRQEKMPSQELLLGALPHIFRTATEDRHILIASIAVLMCSAPDRISEVLTLHQDCEVTFSDGEDEAYGHRWVPSKGARPMIKWRVTVLVDVAREAMKRIRRITQPARDIAKWYYENPNEIFLPADLAYLRNQEWLSSAEINLVLWGGRKKAKSAQEWCKTRKIPYKKVGNAHHFSFSSIEQAVLKMLPIHFPYADNTKNLLLHDALMVAPKDMFAKKYQNYSCLIEPITMGQMDDGLAGRTGAKKTSVISIFKEFGLTEIDGSPMTVHTHEFRHYLNTKSQQAGVGELDIAKWSGRVDLRQNDDYDHSTSKDIVKMVRNTVGNTDTGLAPITAAPKQKNLIKRDDFAQLQITTAHTTDFGYCVHDYTMSTCDKYLDCINCNEHVCLKGDSTKTARIRQQLEEQEALLEQVTAEVERRKSDSKKRNDKIDRWYEHHAHTTNLLRKLCDIMDDPNIPTGSVIQLRDIRPASRIGQAANEKLTAKEKEKKEEKALRRSLAM